MARLDLGPVRKLLAEKKGWRKERIDDVERRYRVFLRLLIDHPGTRFSPPEDVDEFWHMHILDSRAYVRDCDRVFGRYMHHDPHLAVGTVAQRFAWENTQLYAAEYMREWERRGF